MDRLYFAYGSNLCVPRMRHRVPGVRTVARASLRRYALGFPRDYLDRIRTVAALHDPDVERASRNRRFLDPWPTATSARGGGR